MSTIRVASKAYHLCLATIIVESTVGIVVVSSSNRLILSALVVFLFLLGLRHIDFLFQLYSFSFPFMAFGIVNTSDFGFDLSLMLAIGIIISMTVRTLMAKENFVIDSPVNTILLLFLMVVLCSLVPVSLSEEGNFYRWFKQVVLITLMISVYFSIVIHLKRRIDLFTKCLKAYALSSVPVVLWGIYQFVAYYWKAPYPYQLLARAYNASLGGHRLLSIPGMGRVVRVESFLPEPAALALFLIGIIPLVFFAAIKKTYFPFTSNRLNKYYWLAMVLVFFLTFSRSGYFAFGIFLITIAGMSFFLRRTISLSDIKGLLFLGICVVIVSFLVAPFLGRLYNASAFNLIIERTCRITDLFSAEKGISDASMITFKQSLIVSSHMLLEHPLLGVGFGNYGFHFWKYAPQWVLPMNIIAGPIVLARLSGEVGFLGISTFLFFIFAVFREAFKALEKAKRDRRLYILICGLLTSCLIYTTTLLIVRGTNINLPQFWFLLAMVVASKGIFAEE